MRYQVRYICFLDAAILIQSNLIIYTTFFYKMSEAKNKPNPLTEDQRKCGYCSNALAAKHVRATKRGHHKTKFRKNKTVEKNCKSFDGIEENKVVNGVVLSPEVVVLPLIQRTRIFLPYHLDGISLTRNGWIKLLKYGAGLDLSETDGGTNTYIKFVIEANPPVKYLHLYLEKDMRDDSKYLINNWLYAT